MLTFYYTSIRSLSLDAPFRYIFSILVALSLLPTHTLSFSLFGGDYNISYTNLVNCDHSVADRTHTSVTWLGEGFTICWQFKRVRDAGVEFTIEVVFHQFTKTFASPMRESPLNNSANKYHYHNFQFEGKKLDPERRNSHVNYLL